MLMKNTNVFNMRVIYIEKVTVRAFENTFFFILVNLLDFLFSLHFIVKLPQHPAHRAALPRLGSVGGRPVLP